MADQALRKAPLAGRHGGSAGARVTPAAPATHLSLRASADALDTLVAAVVARAVARGAVHPVPPALVAEVEREGWIELPTGTLADLVGEAS